MSSLKDYGDAVLANVVAVWDSATVDLPSLRYVTPGPFQSVSFDCDQVTVTLSPVTRGAPGEPVGGYVRLAEFSVVVTVAVLRTCMPVSDTLEPPSAAAQAAASETTLRDLDLLWRNAETILDAAGCTHSAIAEVSLVEIQGALGGSKLVGTVDLLSLGT